MSASFLHIEDSIARYFGVRSFLFCFPEFLFLPGDEESEEGESGEGVRRLLAFFELLDAFELEDGVTFLSSK